MKTLIILLVLTLVQSTGYTQDISKKSNDLISITSEKLQKDIARSDEKIKHYENEIAKCEKKMADNEKLIALARQNKNTKAEQVGKDALNQSASAKEKNVKLLNIEKSKKEQIKKKISSLRNTLENNTSDFTQCTSIALNYSGDISVTKVNGNKIKMNDDLSTSFISPGDIIKTSPNSKIELQFLEGRGNLVVGENSKLKFSESDTTDFVDLIEGKAKFGVQKLEEFEKEYSNFKRKFGKRFEVRTPTAVCAVRGTTFLVQTNSDSSYVFTVIQGEVEIRSNVNKTSVMIKSGESGTVKKTGEISESVKFDPSTLDNWWD